jgi:hypothetical protein
MAQELTTFADRPALSPKYSKFFEENKNIQDRQTVPSISYEGKKWTIVLNGEKHIVQKKDSDGDLVPVTTLKVVVLDQNPVRGRAYYEGAYNPETVSMPKCWSDDSVTPSKFVKEPCAANCATCPMSVKGSRKSDDPTKKELVACSQHQFIAVVPAFDLNHEPLRMKLAITSIWDGKNKANDEAGWFAFKNYTDFLRANGVDHTGLVVTKMKFDSTVGIGYPKVLFARDRFLTDDDMDILVPIIQSQKVKQLISTSWAPNGVDGVKQGAISGPDDDDAAEKAKDVTPKGQSLEDKAAATQAALDRAAADKAAGEAAEKAARKAAKLAAAQAAADAAKAAAEAAAKAAEDEDDDAPVVTKARAKVDTDDDEPVAPKAAAKADKPKAKADKPAAAVPAGVPAGTAELLGKWGD